MKIRIEDGKTIISTGVGNDVVRNKTGVRGLSYRAELNCYTLAIVVDGKKYHIGNYVSPFKTRDKYHLTVLS